MFYSSGCGVSVGIYFRICEWNRNIWHDLELSMQEELAKIFLLLSYDLSFKHHQ